MGYATAPDEQTASWLNIAVVCFLVASVLLVSVEASTRDAWRR